MDKHEWGIAASVDGPRICRKCGAIEGYTIGKGFGDNRDEPCPGKKEGRMSDKGREAIAKALEKVGLSADISINSVERNIRAHGWLHEDDVVEGRTIDDGPCEYPDRDCGCVACENEEDESCYLTRPATVGDLIK